MVDQRSARPPRARRRRHGVTDRCSEKNNKEKKIFFLSTGVNNNIPEWADSIILEVLGYKTYCCPEPTLRS
jgi:hypothetical protein